MNRTLKKLAVSAAATVAAVAGAVAVSPGTAHASGNFTAWLSPASNPYIFADVQSASTSTLAPVILYHWTGGSNQKWVFWQQASGYYLIQNLNSGKCLWSDGVSGHQVLQVPCDGNQYELWRTGVTTDYVGRTIQNVFSGLYLEVYQDARGDGAKLDTYGWTGGNNQYFQATPA